MAKKGVSLLLVSIVLISIITTINSTSIYSADRPPHVIYEVEWISDLSAKLQLKWSIEDIDEPIMISSYKQVNSQVIEVSYIIGKEAKEGFDERTLRVSDMSFPCIIRLKENLQEADNDNEFPDLGQNADINMRIKHLYDLGIIEGYPDGSFKPKGSVTRAEFSKMLFYSAKMVYNLELDSIFADVTTAHWANDFIYTLAANKIVEGRGNGVFDPNGTITISEILAIIDRTFTIYNSSATYGYELENHWSNENFLNMVSAQIVRPGDEFYLPYLPQKIATREECALLLSRVLDQYHDSNQK